MKTYHIEFKTKAFEGADGRNMKATAVTIGSEIVYKDDSRKFNIALCDDPLYPILEDYVKRNPSTPQPKEKGDRSKFKVIDKEKLN